MTEQLNNYKRILVLLWFAVFFLTAGYTQFLYTGEDPFSVTWKQINTENFRIIYPAEFYSGANRLANVLEYSREYTSENLNYRPDRIPVVIHNNSVVSNGLVSWAPKRIELIPLPPQDSYAEDWLEQLALHEYRHVVQIGKLNQGTGRILSRIMGQQATGAVTGYLPLWFLEGDAVATETALSSTGRGRLPLFEMKLKALLTEKEKRFSYDKMYLGSYRDFVPGYYELGYHMVTYSRLKYDPEIFSRTLDNVAKNPYQLSPFYIGLKKNYNLSKTRLCEETFDTLKYLWNKQINNDNYTNYLNITDNRDKDYTSYRYPEYLNDTMLIALKSGIDQVPQFVMINIRGHEKVLYTPGILSTDRISSCNNKIVWDEIIIDPRWRHRSYSVVKILDIETGRKKQLTHRSRYFSPSVSNDGTKIVAVEVDIRNRYSLVILNSETGNIEKRIPSDQDMFLQLPDWTENNEIVVESTGRKGNSILIYHPLSGQWETMIARTYTDVSQPAARGKYILFRGSFSGVDEIYAVDRNSKEIYRVTSSKYGAFDPSLSPDNKQLIYAYYCSSGYNLVTAKIDTNTWVPLENVRNNSVKWYEQLAAQENINIQESAEPDSVYKPKDYYRLFNLFNVHSWSPFYFDYSNMDLSDITVSAGFTLLSQNILGTAISDIGYSYENGRHYLYPRIIYSGFYPVIEFSAKIGGSSRYLEWNNMTDPPDDMPYGKSYFIRSYLPLRIINNKYIKQVKPQIEYEYNNMVYFNGGYKKGLSVFHYKLNMYRYLKTSDRDIFPGWGQILYLSYSHSTANPIFGSIASVSSRLYFPGLLNHHSLRIYGGIQKQYPKAAILGIDRIILPRGFPVYFSKEIWKMSFDYAFPILYPDISLGPLAYIKRIKMNIFYDHAYGTDVHEKSGNGTYLNTGTYNSTGFELTGDFNVLHFIFPFDSGIRYSYMPGKNRYSVEFLITINTSIL